MSKVEALIPSRGPLLYCRHIDDCLIICSTQEEDSCMQHASSTEIQFSRRNTTAAGHGSHLMARSRADRPYNHKQKMVSTLHIRSSIILYWVRSPPSSCEESMKPYAGKEVMSSFGKKLSCR
ncbi:hypothetical protein KIN20_028959 [Parelaphostrongylus tenuis]|uniref:Reverse transcriptase domain-containing protein n=1 Tax=Parelaphostrongylus tenuis TaxID=148309 RepID=A0AAD5R1J8_PARTN|nr:hypothetical protein KIN20_028959 [Parelaphostrongylus tenuis]